MNKGWDAISILRLKKKGAADGTCPQICSYWDAASENQSKDTTEQQPLMHCNIKINSSSGSHYPAHVEAGFGTDDGSVEHSCCSWCCTKAPHLDCNYGLLLKSCQSKSWARSRPLQGTYFSVAIAHTYLTTTPLKPRTPATVVVVAVKMLTGMGGDPRGDPL
jgi:hypothetical protein